MLNILLNRIDDHYRPGVCKPRNRSAASRANRLWGYRRIQGALSNLGHEIARSTIAAILQRHGIEPAPERSRKTSWWKEFLTQYWDLIVAADFFTVEAWTLCGLQRFVVLFFLEQSTPKIEIAGDRVEAKWLVDEPNRAQSDETGRLLKGKRYLIHDRDPLFTADFLALIEETGLKSIEMPPRSSNLNVYAERFVRTIKESCFDRMILFAEASIREA